MLNWQSPPVRLVIATTLVVGVMAVLWATGVLFPETKAQRDSDGGPSVSVEAASTDIETPRLSGREVGLKAGNLAPNFEFSAFDGRRLTLADFRGQPVFLNFWATWCGPCRAEMPDMQTMLELYGADGLVVIGVNSGEGLDPAQRFIDRLEVDFTAFAYDPKVDIVRLYGVQGLPVSYFIDAEGVITRVVSGQLSFEVMEASVLELVSGDLAAGD